MEAKQTNDKIEISKKVRVVLLGITGSGKSELANTLTGKKEFESSCKGESCTSEVQQEESNWFGNESEERFFLVDTCGFGDSEKRDEMQFEDLLKQLKNFGYVNSFLIVLNGKAPRLDAQLKDMFSKLREAFGEKIFNHVRIVYTNWPLDKREIIRRKKAFDQLIKDKSNAKFGTDQNLSSMEDLRQYEISVLLGIKIPCSFVDSINFKEKDPELVDDKEKNLLTAQFNEIKMFSIMREQFRCIELDVYLAQKKNLDLSKQQDKEFYENLMKQQAKLICLMKKHPESEKEYNNITKNQTNKRMKLNIHLEAEFNKYFDERADFQLQPSLLNDIWTLSKDFSDNDSSRRLSQNNFIKDLEKNLNKKLPAIIETRLKNFIEKEAQDFVKHCDNDLRNLFSGTEIETSINLSAEGISGLTAGVFAGVGAFALAEIGLMALLGVVGMVFLAVGGMVMLAKSLFWDRIDKVQEFSKKASDMVGTQKMKEKLKEICTKSLERVMKEIIYHMNNKLIQKYEGTDTTTQA